MSVRGWCLLLALAAASRIAAAQSPVSGARPDAPSLAGQEEATGSREPWISVSRLGPAELEGASHIELSEGTADLTGEAWNLDADDEIVALLRPLGRAEWTVAAASPAEPGGLFQVAAIRFPEVGDYELIAGIFPAGELTAGRRVEEESWQQQARALSRRLSVRILAPPPAAPDEARPDLAILAVGGAGVDPQAVTPVPARGDVVMRARGLPPGSWLYLAILAPYSDRGYLYGTARRDLQSGLMVLQGIPLEIPGDPRHAHLELIAVASQEPLATGPLSLRSFRRRKLVTSPTVGVTVDEKWSASLSWRVPYLVITRIGRNVLSPTEPPSRPLPVEPGDLVEIGHFERVPEGAQVWLLIRPRGSRLWMAQGPALLRGAPAPDDPLLGAPEVTWVWPGARFEDPEDGGEAAGRRGGSEEFEILAVLSTATLPASWIDSSALSSTFLQAVSPLVPVRVRPHAPRPEIDLAISRIGGEEVDPESEVTVAATEQVEVAVRDKLAPALRIYVARHAIGDSLWSLSEAIPRGRTHVVPSLSFVNPHTREGERHQLIAIVTSGLLPAEQLEYDDLLRAAVAFSEVVTVRYEKGGAGGLASRLARWWPVRTADPANLVSSAGGDTMTPLPPEVSSQSGQTPRRLSMSWLWIVLLLAALAALEWGLGIVSVLARAAADRIERGLRASREWFAPPSIIEPSTFLLGLILAVLLPSVLIGYYLPLYAEAVREVTDLSPKESTGLAVWLVLLTALAGTFLELASDPQLWTRRLATHPLENAAGAAAPAFLVRAVLCTFLIVAILFLMGFQAFFYYTFLRRTVGGIVPGLGGFAFFLIAFIEAMAFFFITKLTLVPAGTMAPRLFRSPFSLLALFLRFLARLFDSIPKRREGKSERTEEAAKEERT